MTSIVLASSSPYRRELLGRLGIPFESWAPEVDERPLSAETPVRTAQRLARAKAEAGAERWPAAWIIGSDQVADLDGAPLGKPGTRENARAQLRALSGNTARFHTALCLFHREVGRRHEEVVTTEVAFRTLSAAEIERYLE